MSLFPLLTMTLKGHRKILTGIPGVHFVALPEAGLAGLLALESALQTNAFPKHLCKVPDRNLLWDN
jgi:hypothetical protein